MNPMPDPESSSDETREFAELRVGERTIQLPMEEGTDGNPAINVTALLRDLGVTTLDYGYANTASTRSAITYLDGDAGILRYRGYPIEQLAEQSTYLEVAYLLIHGELPDRNQYDNWVREITYHTFVHENVKKFMDGFHYD